MNNLKILYEDNHIIVVVKPINVLSQADSTNDMDMLTLIKTYLKEKYQKPGNVYLGLVHRLDRVVGGVMVFAKTSKAASRLSDAIRKNEFHKDYLAICHGKVKESDFNTIVTNKENGKLSELSYELVDYNKKMNISLVKVHLKTGRHHQIRVQFATRGYPLVGDNRYGIDKNKEIGNCYLSESIYHKVSKKFIHYV